MDTSGIVYLVRHCATANDEASHPVLLGRNLDYGLSAIGHLQAEGLAAYFESKGLDAIYTSPQVRAVQTAHKIAERTDMGMTFCPSLAEADMGEWEGATYAEVMENDPDNFSAHLKDPGTCCYPGGENLGQVCSRAFSFIESLTKKHPDQRVAIVTHKYVNRTVLARLMGMPLQRLREIDQDPGCVNVIRVFHGVMELQAVNCTSNFDLIEEDEEQCTSYSNTPATLE